MAYKIVIADEESEYTVDYSNDLTEAQSIAIHMSTCTGKTYYVAENDA